MPVKDPKSASQPKDSYWLDKPSNVSKIVYGLYGFGALLLFSQLLFKVHGHFAFEHWFGFYAAFGFFSYVGLIYAAIRWRKIVQRDEDYYGEQGKEEK